MAKRHPEQQSVKANMAEDAPSSPEHAPLLKAPPQEVGAPLRSRIDGSTAREPRLNAAMHALLSPTELTRATRVYSGQSRHWSQ